MQNLLDPAILFFVFGVLAGTLKSNLELPQAVTKFLSLYLLMALGLKGGFALAESGFSAQLMTSLLAAMTMAVLVPWLGYLFLKRWISPFNAAAVAASYGSVSAVTFVTAMQYLEAQGLPFGGHMAVAMVLMESPAILMAIVFANMLRQNTTVAQAGSSGGAGVAVLGSGGGGGSPTRFGKVLHESFTDGSHLLLIGALVVGYLSGSSGQAVMQPFAGDLFKGMLAFFLLDMGLLVARNFSAIRHTSPVLLLYAVVGPWLHAMIALLLAWILKLPASDGLLLMVLSASASYIVVPAVLRSAIPEANPSLYFGLSLGITFPMNLLVGIPVYGFLATTWLST